jgi:hypothetical protein
MISLDGMNFILPGYSISTPNFADFNLSIDYLIEACLSVSRGLHKLNSDRSSIMSRLFTSWA